MLFVSIVDLNEFMRLVRVFLVIFPWAFSKLFCFVYTGHYAKEVTIRQAM